MSSPSQPAHPSPAGLSRRNLLALGGAGLGALALPAWAAPSAAAATDPYSALRTTWSAYLTGGAIDPSNPVYAPAISGLNAEAQAYLSTMQSGTGITSLWPDLPLGTVSANLTSTFKRLKALATAYAVPGTSYTDSTTLAASISAGLDFMVAGPYAKTVSPYNNWWDWQIGCTQSLEDTAILLYSQLSSTQIANYCASIDAFVPDPTKQTVIGGTANTSTGANRLDECRAVIVRGALGENSASISTAVTAISPVLPLVMYGDGLYADGSFTQHTGVAYTGTYGQIYFNDIAALVLLLAGTTWAITDPNLSVIYTGVTNGFAPVVYNGLMIDSVRGRAISRYSESDATDGFTAATTLLLYAQATTDPTQAAAWQATAKGWLERNTVCTTAATTDQVVNLTTGATVPVSIAGTAGIALAESVLSDSSISAAAEPQVHYQFPNMDRTIHRRPGWAYSLSMCSSMVDRYESINGENLHGWYTGDGMGYLYLDGDVAQFNDAYWDTVDMYQLPGTTTDQGTVANAVGEATKPTAKWVGGSVLSGTYGAVGMQLQAHSTNLTAAKSWFCLDDEIVALGAGITSTSGNSVVTTVENRNLHTIGNNSLYINGTAQSISAGWSTTADSVQSACLTGVAGYCFLDSGGANNVQFSLTDQSGNWYNVNTLAPTTLANDTRPYLSIALNHGANPSAAGYAYAILPNCTQAQTAAYASSPKVSVLANTTAVQAITDATLGVTMANFYAAATAGPITVSAAASVSMQISGSDLTIAVSDPTWASATLAVTIAGTGYTSVASADPTVTVLSSTGGAIQLLVETGGSRGASHSVTLSTTGTALTPATATLLAPTDNTYVDGGADDATNYGGGTSMAVKNSTGAYDRISLLKFSTTGVTGTVGRAILWVNGHVSDSGGSQATLTAYALSNDTWTETTVTFNTAPSLTTSYGTGQISTTNDWISLDVTGLVATATGGITAIGLWEASAGLDVTLSTKESGTAKSPILEVITS